MEGTIWIEEQDEPAAQMGPDDYLRISCTGSDFYVFITDVLKADLRRLVRDWDEEADAASRADDGHPMLQCTTCGKYAQGITDLASHHRQTGHWWNTPVDAKR